MRICESAKKFEKIYFQVQKRWWKFLQVFAQVGKQQCQNQNKCEFFTKKSDKIFFIWLFPLNYSFCQLFETNWHESACFFSTVLSLLRSCLRWKTKLSENHHLDCFEHFFSVHIHKSLKYWASIKPYLIKFGQKMLILEFCWKNSDWNEHPVLFFRFRPYSFWWIMYLITCISTLLFCILNGLHKNFKSFDTLREHWDLKTVIIKTTLFFRV